MTFYGVAYYKEEADEYGHDVRGYYKGK